MAILRFPDGTIAFHPLLSCDGIRIHQGRGRAAQSSFFFCAAIFLVD
jgi:hypothetical protein